MTIDSVPELARRVRHLETLVKRGKPADGSDNASLLKRISALESSVARIGKAAPTKPQVYTPKPAATVPKPANNSLAIKVSDHGALTGLADDDHTQYTKHPASSTDNAIARWDGTTGRILQNSGITINDNGQLSGDGLDGWCYDTDTWTYVSATSFKITGKNVRYRFPKGTKIKLVQSGATKYFYVIATAYTSGNTIITITGGSDYALANATISGQAYSYAAAPQGFPQWFNFTPTLYTGWSALPTGTYIFKIIGMLCIYPVDMGAGTSNGTSAELSIPVPSISSITKGGANGYAVDNGTTLTGASRWRITGADNKVQFHTNMATGAWTNSGTKRVGALIIYEF